ncbi:MAG: zinc-ribbon domain-containing protein [Promethearchaeota archaeon]
MQIDDQHKICGDFVVRNLSLHFLYRKEGARVVVENESVDLIDALASAESQRSGSGRIVSLSRVSFPFWIVQTSPTKSIVLSASSSIIRQFQFSEIKGSSEIRRIVSSEISQASDIPVAATKIEPLLDKIDTYTADLSNLINPQPVVAVGNYIVASDPNAQPNRVEIRTDSGGALKRSEEFKGVSEAVRLRIEAAEALKSLLREKFGGQYSILENLVSLERKRWDDRIKQMEERTNQEIVGLKKNRDDQLYDLGEKHKMNLRALTADFARAANDLEQHFTQISEQIREAKTKIGQKEDDVDGAISIYEKLANHVRGTVERSLQPIQIMDSKRVELEKRVAEVKKEYEQEKVNAESSLESQLNERQQRIENTKEEREQNLKELDELKLNARTVIDKTYQAVENKVIKFQEEFLSLMSWTLDNNSINELAPLTQLDIHTYIVRFDNGTYKILTPHFLLDEGASSSLGGGQSLSSEFDAMLTSSIDEWMKSDRSFKDAFEHACIKGNVFLDPKAENMLSEGLESLSRRRVLQTTDIERYGTLWYRYAGKCPKCGAELEAGAKFCNSCGLEL